MSPVVSHARRRRSKSGASSPRRPRRRDARSRREPAGCIESEHLFANRYRSAPRQLARNSGILRGAPLAVAGIRDDACPPPAVESSSPSSPSPSSWRSASFVRARTSRRRRAGRQGADAAHRAPVPVTLATVEKKDVPVWLEGLGTVAAWQQVHGARAGRRPARQGALHARGRRCKQGRPARADRSAAVRGAAAPGRGRARARPARSCTTRSINLERYQRAARAEARSRSSRSTIRRRSSARPRARCSVDEAQIETAQAQPRLRAHHARRIDGVTGVRLVDAGNLVHATDATGLVVITQLDPIAVFFTLPQDELPAGRRGAGARRRCRSRPGAATARRKLGDGTLVVDRQPDQPGDRDAPAQGACSPTPSACCGRTSSSRRACSSTTRKDALVVAGGGGAARAAGHVRLRRRRRRHGAACGRSRSRITVGDAGGHRQGPRSPASRWSSTGRTSCGPAHGRCSARGGGRRRAAAAAAPTPAHGGEAEPVSISEPFIRRPVATTLLMIGLLLAGMRRLPPAAGRRAAAGRLSDDRRLDHAARRERRDDGVGGDDAARAAVRADAVAHADDVGVELRQLADHAAVHARPQHRRRRAGRAGGDQRRVEPAAAHAAGAADLLARSTPPTRRSSRSRSAPTRCRCRRSTTTPTRCWRRRSRRSRASAWSRINGGQKPAVRVQVDPAALAGTGLTLEDVRAGARRGQRQPAQGQPRRAAPGLHASRPTISSTRPTAFRPLVIAYKNGAPVRLADVANVVDGVENAQLAGWAGDAARDHPERAAPAGRQRHRGRRPREGAPAAAARVAAAGRSTSTILTDRTETVRASVEDVQFTLRPHDRPGRARHLRLPAQLARDDHPRRRGAAVARSAPSASCTCSATASTTCR